MATVIKRKWKTDKGEQKTAWRVNYVDQAGKRNCKQFSRKRDADSFRIKVEGQIQSGMYRADASKISIKDVSASFLEYCEGRMKRNERMTRKMYVVYKGHVNNHILHEEVGIGQYKLSQLTARTVGDFRDRIRDAGVTVPTARKILATLHAILEYAISQDLVAVNAAHGIKVVGPRDQGSKKIIPPSKEDLRKLLEEADEDFRLKLLFAASTGVRAGEQWALKWQDVNFKAGELHVERRVDSYGEEGPPKSVAGVRVIPISSLILKKLKEFRLKSDFSKADDLVFPNREGSYTCHDNIIKRKFKPLFDKLEKMHKEDPIACPKPPKRFNWHGLRHFAVSTWIEAKLAPKTVQTFAGHSSLSITMDRYGHMFPSDDHKKAMDGIAGELIL